MARPLSVTLTLWLVLILSVSNMLRAWTVLAWQEVLLEFSAKQSPAVSAGIGIFWAVAGLVLWWGLYQRKAWAGKLLYGAGAGYTVWYWGERVFFQNPREGVWFAVILNLAVLILIFATNKTMMREAYERTIENQKTE
jgi:hypothetical protein